MRQPLPALLVALLLLWLGGAKALPDLQRGKAALAAGDLAGARRDLQPLAEQGYQDAQLQLANAYARQETPAGDREALRWFRLALPRAPQLRVRTARLLLRIAEAAPAGSAAQQQALAEAEPLLRQADAEGDASALVPLLALLTAHPERDTQERRKAVHLVAQAERLQTPDGEAALLRWYRANPADTGERLLALCTRAAARLPECAVDMGRHYRASGNSQALAELVARTLAQLDRQQLDPGIAERLGSSLISEAQAGAPDPKNAYALLSRVQDQSTEARTRLAKLLLAQPDLDPGAKPDRLLASAVDAGSQEAALALARLYLRGEELPVEPRTAERLLLKATAEEPAAHYFLGQIYQRGELGRAEPVRAAEHYLQAARRGYPRGDLALARLYSDNRGVRVDRANAYLFARLAAADGVAEAIPLLDEQRRQLGQDQIEQAEARVSQEQALRQHRTEAEAAQLSAALLAEPVPDDATPAPDAVGTPPAPRLEQSLDARRLPAGNESNPP
ncbi:MAG: hypothetical protein Q8Q73_04405 [Stagnimonas sp.]|nr:hypothetical protein [Stagnimonas sp.]